MTDVTKSHVRIREFPRCQYLPMYEQMQSFSLTRNIDTLDEFWLLEHEPVYTLGLNGKSEHVLNPGLIPVVNVDRGGQVTYHGPGQLIVYLLIDVKRKSMGVRAIVTAMEKAIIELLADLNITASAKPEAPGVYVGDKKIAALGLRIKNGKSYHGLSLNIDMDLQPFEGINPCGYENQAVVNLRDLGCYQEKQQISDTLVQYLMRYLTYSQCEYMRDK